MELKGKQKRHLRGLGHGMRPLVTVGKQGITPPLLRQVEECLLAYELVKVKALESCPLDRKALGERLCGESGAALVQTIGRMLLIYRPHPEEPKIVLPA